MKRLTIILSLILSMVSCREHEAQLTYQIKNNATTTIRVLCTNTNKVATDTFEIGNNEQATIAINGQGLNRVSKYKETDDRLRDFTQMDISINDTLKSTVDFLKTNLWTYNEIDKHSAEYLLTVNDSDF